MTAPVEAALVWDPAAVAYRFGPDHPFNPRRLDLTVSLIEALRLVDDRRFPVVRPTPAPREALLLVHDPEYVDAVRRLGSSESPDADAGLGWGLGTEDNPIFPRMHEATAAVVGGTLKAAELVMSGAARRAFAVAGGLHHAHRGRASGFCVYSDLGVAIEWIRRTHGARVLYIDHDAHHGDGVQGLFYDADDVLTVSLHESGRYLFPGTGFIDELGAGEGFGYSLNVPVEPFTEDDSWLSLYRSLIPEVAAAFRPDVIVLQNGCDAHRLDPLTHLHCSTRSFEEIVRITCEVADEHCGGRIVATGGGGYAVWQVVPRAWTLAWAVLSGQEPPERIPMAWLQRWQGESPVVLPERLRDGPGDAPAVPRTQEIEEVNRRTLAALRRGALPVLRGWGMAF